MLDPKRAPIVPCGGRSSFRGCFRPHGLYAGAMPSTQPQANITERVVLTLRLDAAHAARIARIAAAQKRSTNAQIEIVLAEFLATHDDTGKPS